MYYEHLQQARAAIIAAWREEALKEMQINLAADELEAISEEDIESWALDIASANGDTVKTRQEWII